MKKILLPIAVGIALLASCGENAQEETLNTDIIDNPISAESSAEDEDKRPFF
ncbi:MAG: hypothetical protein HRT73_14970, partial [Flavobacteriales bacterium]|nr:hypothetical protein [Flavobacteriales bacterium]